MKAADASRPFKRSAGKGFRAPQRAETSYARQLRKIAKHVGELIRSFPVGDPAAVAPLQTLLDRYAEVIEPWARTTASQMLDEVSRREGAAWFEAARKIGASLGQEIRSAPTGEALRAKLAENVRLITSLPREAGERVHRLTLEGIENSARASEIAKEIMRSGDVTASRATLIARTEVARTSSLLTQARSEHIGCTHFVWRTAEDSDVRASHRKMANKVCEFASPPIVDGQPLIPGQTFNCRCYIEPIIPDVIN